MIAPETFRINSTDSISDTKECRAQAEQFTFRSLFGVLTHLILELSDQVVQFALDMLALLFKQGETNVQDAYGADELLVEVCAATGGINQVPNRSLTQDEAESNEPGHKAVEQRNE